jgi:hypothetical protein
MPLFLLMQTVVKQFFCDFFIVLHTEVLLCYASDVLTSTCALLLCYASDVLISTCARQIKGLDFALYVQAYYKFLLII